MGVPRENIKKFTNITHKEFVKIMREAWRTYAGMQKDGEKQFLMVYVAGHGAMDTMQHFVLNDTNKFSVNIEERLRGLAASTGTNVLVFYDICRTDINKIKGFDESGTKGRGKADYEEDESAEEKDFAAKYNYIHIGTHPKQIVSVNSKLAELTISTLTERAKENPNNLVTVPFCFSDMGGID